MKFITDKTLAAPRSARYRPGVIFVVVFVASTMADGSLCHSAWKIGF